MASQTYSWGRCLHLALLGLEMPLGGSTRCQGSRARRKNGGRRVQKPVCTAVRLWGENTNDAGMDEQGEMGVRAHQLPALPPAPVGGAYPT